jgi:competence protein ComGC
MMSPEHRYLNFALIVSVLFLMFAPNAAAETAKEQLQGSMDRVIEVLRTIRSPEDIERNRNSLREILFWSALILRQWRRNRSGLGGMI